MRAAMYKTNVHATTIGEMAKGVTPGRGVIEDFAGGMGISPAKLLALAGYEMPPHVIEGVELALRSARDVSDEGKRRIAEFVKEAKAKYGVDHCEDEGAQPTGGKEPPP